jgi:hypothetical protein
MSDTIPDCFDCHATRATVFLPEGRYLCWACWEQLRDLRAAVVADSNRRGRQRLRAYLSRKPK